jgi:hypothetical protein
MRCPSLEKSVTRVTGTRYRRRSRLAVVLIAGRV